MTRSKVCEHRPRESDTLEAVVDLGLGHRAKHRLRLRGIDTPELYTRAVRYLG